MEYQAVLDHTFKIREIILNVHTPLVLRNFATNWTCFPSSIEEWCGRFDEANNNARNAFERVSNSTSGVQWERQRDIVQLTAMEFLDCHKSSQNYWTALNYKRAHELPLICRRDIDFGLFGFPQSTPECNFWLSSAGSNTPCHRDTYGCNIVVQVYGKKSWLMFPPDVPLTSTRVPYEESSVYCLENFYAPDPADINQLCKFGKYAYHCILEPKDVLIVPHKWWHYVEAFEMSLSINAWIPLTVDLEAQLEECIVKYLIERLIQNSSKEVIEYTLNPNQVTEITEENHLLDIFEHIVKITNSGGPDERKKQQTHFIYQALTPKECSELRSKFNLNYFEVLPMTDADFAKLLVKNSKRFTPNKCRVNTPLRPLKEDLINSICNPTVIHSIKTEFLKRNKCENAHEASSSTRKFTDAHI